MGEETNGSANTSPMRGTFVLALSSPARRPVQRLRPSISSAFSASAYPAQASVCSCGVARCAVVVVDRGLQAGM
jgi:hypothetical protein